MVFGHKVGGFCACSRPLLLSWSVELSLGCSAQGEGSRWQKQGQPRGSLSMVSRIAKDNIGIPSISIPR